MGDVFGPAACTREQLRLQDLNMDFAHRDTSAGTVLRFRDLFRDVWHQLPDVDRGIIGRQIERRRRAFGMPGIAGCYLLPSVNFDAAAYVTGGALALVFDSFTFERLIDRESKHTIRHELAHVWQEATGMTRGPLTDEQLEILADWQADHQLITPVWRPLTLPAPLPAPDPESFRAE